MKDESFSKIAWIIFLALLFPIAFWQSWSGVFIYVLAFSLGAVLIAFAEKRGGE